MQAGLHTSLSKDELPESYSQFSFADPLILIKVKISDSVLAVNSKENKRWTTMKTGSLGTRSMVCVAFLLYTALSLALLASPVKDVLEGTETDAGVKLPRARRRLQRLGMSDCFSFGAINYVRVRLLVSCRYSLSRFLAAECDCAKVRIVATLTTVGTRSRTVSSKKM